MFEHVAADALRAVREVLAKYGLEDAGVVVNLAWRDPTDKNEFAVGTAVPTDYPMLTDSLRQSADESEHPHE